MDICENPLEGLVIHHPFQGVALVDHTVWRDFICRF